VPGVVYWLKCDKRALSFLAFCTPVASHFVAASEDVAIGQESSFLLQLESVSNFSFLQDRYACFPSGVYHLLGLGFRFPLDFCKSLSCLFRVWCDDKVQEAAAQIQSNLGIAYKHRWLSDD